MIPVGQGEIVNRKLCSGQLLYVIRISRLDTSKFSMLFIRKVENYSKPRYSQLEKKKKKRTSDIISIFFVFLVHFIRIVAANLI